MQSSSRQAESRDYASISSIYTSAYVIGELCVGGIAVDQLTDPLGVLGTQLRYNTSTGSMLIEAKEVV
jgi:hypothetical protein